MDKLLLAFLSFRDKVSYAVRSFIDLILIDKLYFGQTIVHQMSKVFE